MSTPRSRRKPEDGSPPEPEATSPGEQEAGVEPAEEIPAAQPPADEEPRWAVTDLGASLTEEPPADEEPAGELGVEEPDVQEELDRLDIALEAGPPEGVYTAQEPLRDLCRMCSSPIDQGDQFMVLKMGRRVHYGACSDQARAAGYMGQLESDAGPA